MNLLAVFEQSKTSVPTLSETLFKESNISQIDVNMFKHVFDKSFYWVGQVHFEKDSIKGSKKFKVEGKDGMVEVVKNMENFIKSL